MKLSILCDRSKLIGKRDYFCDAKVIALMLRMECKVKTEPVECFLFDEVLMQLALSTFQNEQFECHRQHSVN